MAGGIKQKFFREIKPGDKLTIKRKISDIYKKTGKSGPLVFIVYEISVSDEQQNMIMEITQSRINR